MKINVYYKVYVKNFVIILRLTHESCSATLHVIHPVACDRNSEYWQWQKESIYIISLRNIVILCIIIFFTVLKAESSL